MQYITKEMQRITESLANVIKELRDKRTGLSASKFAIAQLVISLH